MMQSPDDSKSADLQVGRLYLIQKIHPQCEWYARRQDFEGKLMRCAEVFEAENAAGFCFVNRSDCPEEYSFSRAFCFSRVETTSKLFSFLPSSGKNRTYSLFYQTSDFLN